MKKIKLKLTKRSNDWHCAIENDATIWDCGKTRQEAIGNWILTHGKDYGIEIE